VRSSIVAISERTAASTKSAPGLALLTSRSVTKLASTIGSAFALRSAKSRVDVLYRALKHKSGRKRCWLNAVIRGRDGFRCASQSSLRFRRALTHRPE
jgi:hypothetical protein